MRKFVTLLFAVLLLAGCAATPKPVPEGYKGPLVRVFDTRETVSRTRVHFFELEKADGRQIKTSSWETREYNQGQGFNMVVRLNARYIPAGKSVLTLSGVTHVAADILAFTGGMYSVSGDVSVDLEEGKHYYVKGRLSKAYSAVWLEDGEGNIVSEKIEKK